MSKVVFFMLTLILLTSCASTGVEEFKLSNVAPQNVMAINSDSSAGQSTDQQDAAKAAENLGGKDLEKSILTMEMKMWDAFADGNAEKFLEVVANDAVMVVGGITETGADYAKFIPEIDVTSYKIEKFSTKVIHPNVVLTNYFVKIEAPNTDAAGTFNVSSLWKKTGIHWKLVFNQDARIYGEIPQ
ncbi:DUF4440 domain-containing protein [Paenibacillus lutrae]|uniref:DUF4440 domain-containing protein n=1 Tax=Paenibacillus lutrae TaxID=2078573 RepID=A0A7X3FFI2_9BACL|nr:DUF4440 domain-containing protein [Paenibacillus lutrae]